MTVVLGRKVDSNESSTEGDTLERTIRDILDAGETFSEQSEVWSAFKEFYKYSQVNSWLLCTDQIACMTIWTGPSEGRRGGVKKEVGFRESPAYLLLRS